MQIPAIIRSNYLKKCRANEQYEKSVDIFISKVKTPSVDFIFWANASELGEICREFSPYNSKSACEEFARRCYCERDFTRFILFYKQYLKVSGEIYDKLNNSNIEFGLGDDSFGDLCDSLPMANQMVFDTIMKNGYTTFEQIKRGVRKYDRKDGAKWAEFILEGENYFHMFLRDALMQYIGLSQPANTIITF